MKKLLIAGLLALGVSATAFAVKGVGITMTI